MKPEKNNFQDEAMEREYQKGKRSGNQKRQKRGSRNGGSRGRKESKSFSPANVPIFTGSKDNDPSWYANNPTLLRNVANLPFSYPLGFQWDLGDAGEMTTLTADPNPALSLPGILSFQIMPTFGYTQSPIDAINVAFSAMFNFVRHATSGQSRYEAPDLGIYCLAMDSAYSYYAWMVRVYGVMSDYSVFNKYTPKTLVETMGVNFESLKSNLADFRAAINLYAVRLASFAVPRNITYMTRHIWMYENIYRDAESSKAQLYMYNPEGFYIFNETGDSNLFWNLTFIPLPAFDNKTLKLMTLSDIVAYGESILNPILQTQDMMFISADILKAFGAGSLFRVTPIGETYAVSPVYSKEVLSQMENAFIYGASDQSCTITEEKGINNGYITGTLQIKIPPIGGRSISALEALHRDAFPLNFHWDPVSPEDIMVATRLSSSGSVEYVDTSSGWRTFNILDCGSEIVVSASIIYEPDMGQGYSPIDFGTYNVLDVGVNAVQPGALRQLLQLISNMSSFDWHPKLYFGLITSTSPTSTKDNTYLLKSGEMLDIDNFTIVNPQELQSMNRVAMLSLFSCNDMGTFNFKV